MSSIKLLSLLLGISVPAQTALPDFDSWWNYDKPAETAAKFHVLVPEAKASGNADYYLQLLTQIARTQSLQGKFPEAHAILDEVEPSLNAETPVAEVRYLLERGRSYRSAGEVDRATPLFLRAFELGRQRALDFHAVDAAHMMALVEKTKEKQLEWNFLAIELAKASNDPRAQDWLGSLYNNIGWTYQDAGRLEEALAIFREGVAWRESRHPGSEGLRIAKWSVGYSLRSLKRYEEAMTLQRALEAEYETLPKKGEYYGFTLQELAELFLLNGQKEEARSYFGRAYDRLKDVSWVDPAELARMKELGGR
jgi:tetratricopeptide (TPR) repeat protein